MQNKFEKYRKHWSQWPALDQQTWEEAIKPKSWALEQTKAMMDLAALSVRNYSIETSRARQWAISHDVSSVLTHAEIWNEERLKAYVDSLKGKRSSTIRLKLVAIERVMAAVGPKVDRRFLLDEINNHPREIDQESKRNRLQETQALVDFGVALMKEARSLRADNSRKWVKYRTGLQIALLAGRPFRLQAFTDIEYLGEQPDHAKRPYIIRCGNSWFIGCPDNTGLRKKYSPPARVHRQLVPYINEYMSEFRPMLRGDDGFGSLWASTRSQEPRANGIYKRIVHYTKIGFNIAVNPHLFRDCYATSMPEAHHALGNSPQITATVYDLSTTREASSKINQSRGRFILDDDRARASIRGLQRKV